MHPVAEALKGRQQIDQEIARLLKRHYPPGGSIKWTAHAGRTYRGIVVRNCYGDRLEVLNIDTQRKRFIYAYQIIAPLSDTHRPEKS